MNNSLIFWTYAYFLMLAMLILAFVGIRRIRHGDYQGHLIAMVRACNLVFVFVASYVLKVMILGRENKEAWSLTQYVILYVHESFILMMLICGTRARILANRFKGSLSAGNPTETEKGHRLEHARWGKLTIGAALAAFFTASFVVYYLMKQ